MTIEPTEFRFAFGVDIVIDVHHTAAELAALIEKELAKCVDTAPVLADMRHRRATGKFSFQQLAIPAFSTSAAGNSSIRLMIAKSASSICLRKMYAALEEKTTLGRILQDFQSVARLDDDAVGGNFERLCIDLLQGPNDRRHQVRAASHGFGDHDVRASFRR